MRLRLVVVGAVLAEVAVGCGGDPSFGRSGFCISSERGAEARGVAVGAIVPTNEGCLDDEEFLCGRVSGDQFVREPCE